MKTPMGITLLLVPAFTVFGRIGDTSVDFKRQYGDPVAESADNDGHAVRDYRSPEFKRIRVTFVNDKSVLEKYTAADAVKDKEALLTTVYKQSRDQDVEMDPDRHIDGDRELEVGPG